jgi:hypothetical protein
MNPINPPPKLDDFKAVIEQRRPSHTTLELLFWLRSQGVETSERALQRKLKEWGITKQAPITINDDETYPILVEAVNTLYHFHPTYSDDKIAQRIGQYTKLSTTARQVKSIRFQNRWYRRTNNAGVRQDHKAETQNFIQQLLQHDGTQRSYGHRQMIAHLASQYGFRPRKDDVLHAMKQLDQYGAWLRDPRVQKPESRRDVYESEGPDWLWCLDGHDKLKRFGIEIYGCVDAYSRKIIWMFVGSSNATAVSVIRQYLLVTKLLGKCPNRIRTDAGREVPMMADAHYHLYLQALLNEFEAERLTKELLEKACFADCYIFGKSTANIRIEGLWGIMIRQITGQWMKFFETLVSHDLYREDLESDRVIIAFIFIPIIKAEIFKWVDDRNSHSIRNQSERSYLITGVPNDLYRGDVAPVHGFLLDQRMHRIFESRVIDYGKLYTCHKTLYTCHKTFYTCHKILLICG